jgi:adenylate cyclase
MEGDRKAGIAGIEAALAEIERAGERLYEPGLLIGSSYLLGEGGGDRRSSRTVAHTAERGLRRALDVARAQGARLMELRAAVALAHLWHARGKTADARHLLAEAHAWFANRAPAAPEIAEAQRLLEDLGT